MVGSLHRRGAGKGWNDSCGLNIWQNLNIWRDTQMLDGWFSVRV